ncbi:MAG TPA: hypothetical protein VIQ11_13030 [Mycobacterium sp.]
MADVNVQIAAAGDDGGWSEAGYFSSTTATIIRLGDASDSDYGRSAWFRWATGIPAQALVTTANLTLIPKGISGSIIPTLRIRASDEDNPAIPASRTDATGRPRTTAYVDWTPAAWGSGVAQASPDISAMIQEVVSRPGFSGTVMLFVEDLTTGSTTLTGQLSMDSYESSPANTARLTATYTPQTVPTAAIGGPTTVASSSGITVTGTGTPTTAGATISGYQWRVISGLGSLNNTALQNPTFMAAATAGTTVLGLVVADSNGLQSVEATRTITITGGSAITVHPQIGASLDDGSWHNEGAGSTSSNGANVTVGDSSSTDNARWGWVRFVLNVPQGATISTADITVKAVATATVFPTMTIVAVDLDDGPSYVNRAQYTGLAQTTAAVPWTPTVWTNAASYTTPELKTVIQEIVDRPGWVSGNHILLFFKVPVDAWSTANAIKFATWDAAPADSAILNVTYAQVTPTPNAGADQGPVDSQVAVSLSSAGSSGSPDTYLWEILSGGGTLSSASAANPTYKPPATAEGGQAVIGLKVGVGGVGAAQDTVTIIYRPHTEWIVGGTPVLSRMT